MYRTKRRTETFDVNSKDDMKAYDRILNNPLCTLISKDHEKISERSFNDEGKISGFHDKLLFIVTWEEKILAD